MIDYRPDYNPTMTFHYDSGDGVIRSHTVPGEETWPNLFEEMRNFLNGCGYHVRVGEWLEEEDVCDFCRKRIDRYEEDEDEDES